jgi:hypothetical protein
LLHRDLLHTTADVEILVIGELSREVCPNFGNLMRGDGDALRLVLGGGPFDGWIVTRSPDHRSLMFFRDGRFLTVQGQTDVVIAADGDPGESAWFMAISGDDVAVLADVLSGEWLVQSADSGTRPERGSLTPGFVLNVGSLAVDLRWNLPFDRSQWPHRLPVLRDGWRIDLIYRFRPLVYFAAFGGSAFMQQFALSLESLATAGAYEGAIAVLTDKTPAEISTLAPPVMRSRLIVLPTSAHDKLAYMAARLTIGTWPEARDCQPLLYVDADILFDLPIAPMLWAIARSGRICAPAEPEPLAGSTFVGGYLLQADNCSPGSRMGFNSGTLGIPNLRRFGPALDLIGRVMHNRASLCGRDGLPYADQPIANYVLYRLDAVDTELISPYVRLANNSADPADRRGLVHFCWVADAGVRADVMRAYLGKVTALDATADRR